MSAPRLFVLIAILTGAGAPALRAQGPAATPIEGQVLSEAQTQVGVNKAALLEGKDEQTRVNAATLLVFSSLREARDEVLRVLRDGANPLARAAVCRALTLAREDKRTIANKAEFVEPLMIVLRTEEDPARAELAAQAMLMFSYDDIQKHLDSLFTDPNASRTAQVNAIRALMYEPDDRAIFKLVSLLEGPNPDLAVEASKALTLLGLEVPSDPNGIRALTEALHRRGPEAFLRNPLIMRNWLVSRENRIAELQTAVASWEQLYLAALRQLYGFQADEKAKGEFLARQLSSPEASVKLWALGQLRETQTGTGKIKPSEQLESILLSLVSNRDRRVRLGTANLLEYMWELNSTQQLLAQLEVEEDAEVRQGLFKTLVTVCYNAPLATSAATVPQEIRKRTLELAVSVLNQTDPARVKSGADAIRKLLEQNGLAPEDVDRYLRALVARYEQVGPAANHGLRGDLLAAMAGLCSPRSFYRTQAVGLYRPLFERARLEQADSVRQAAVDGLVNIDKPMALRQLRAGFVDDANPAIRARLIDLAGEVGGSEDLDWLAGKVGQGAEGESAWQAMLRIFGRSGPDVIDRWKASLDSPDSKFKLTAEQRIAFLLMAEQNAQAENRPDEVKDIRLRLFGLYALGNDATKASETMDRLFAAAADGEKAAMGVNLLGVCLGPATQFDLAGAVIEKSLRQRDLGPEDPIAESISIYLAEPPEGGDPNALLARLGQISVADPERQSRWRSLLVQWQSFARARDLEQTEKISN